MAEINTAAAKPKPGVRRSKKLSTRVDLTPMVDLGFLLITFFIFTTTISEPSALRILMPAGDTSDMPIGESAALTIIPKDNDQVFYYHGKLEDAIASGAYGLTNYSVTKGLGDIIRQKQQAMDRHKPASRNDLMLIIKPVDRSNVQNLVRILDEVAINAVKHYAVVDMSEAERTYLEAKKIEL
jgi:hypothetical protein